MNRFYIHTHVGNYNTFFHTIIYEWEKKTYVDKYDYTNAYF